MAVVLAQSLDTVTGRITQLVEAFLASLPLVVVGLVVAAIALIAARWLANSIARALRRSDAGPLAVDMLSRLARALLYLLAVLFALSVTGVPVGGMLGALAVFGIAVGLAAREVFANFIAGLLLAWRQPFKAGDQIITGDYQGTVDTIDLRVTHLIDDDGELILIPNHDVYTNPLINLTTRGPRRNRVTIGVDYDDDHNGAREIIRAAVTAVDGVAEEPPAEVLLAELADSSVNFEIRYWTEPDITVVGEVRDRVLSDVKSALEDAGMTIPWPVRTVVIDTPVTIERSDDAREVPF